MNSNIGIFTLFVMMAACVLSRALATSPNRTNQNITISLALLASTGVLLATGAIEMTGRYGYSAIFALFAFTLVFVIAPLILFPIRRLSKLVRFATSVDFLTFRYRGKSVAIWACSVTILSVIPLLVAQLLSIESVVTFIFGEDKKTLSILAVLGIISLISWKSIQARESNPLRWVLAAAGILLLCAIGLSAWIVTDAVFGGVSEMNQWAIDSNQQNIIKRFNSSYSLFIVFLAASLSYPINFDILVSEDISDRQASMSCWVYPLLVLLICIPLIPLLWSGLALQPSSSLQQYLYTMPMMVGHPIVSSLGAASILLLGIALCSVLTILSAKMVLNSVVLPDKNLYHQKNLTAWINRRTFIVSVSLVIFSIALCLNIKSHSITDLYLVGFAGLAQLMPGIIAAMYLPKMSRPAFIAGLAGGILVWLLTLALPVLFGDWSWHVPLIDKTLLFGMQAWEVWSIEALLLNITLCTLFSLFGKMDEEQKSFASICMADNVYIPVRVEINQKSVAELTERLGLSLGDEAQIEMESALKLLGFDDKEIRPASLRQLRDAINASLNLRFGILAAERIMSHSLPRAISNHSEPEDIYLLESVLAVHGDQLTGIASELNKLRVHHREVLDKLPIGVISLDQNGEILKWNTAISTYTDIDKDSALGSSVMDLPEPWKAQIREFLASDDKARDNVRLENSNGIRWFSLQKSTEDSLEASNDDVILLIEEQTKAVLLTQKSIDNERLASIGRLAAGVAHEIGNPVTGIACLAQNLQHETEPSQILESAQHILSQTDRINRIVESLINFSKGDKSKEGLFTPVNLRDVAEEAIQLLTLGDLESKVIFTADIEPDMEVLGDYHQLVQIFLNLLSNSRDASPANSQVTILAERDCEIIRVTVNDSGTGIEQGLQSQLYEPFVTTKEPGQGTGLGLWIVFKLVKGLGADISISSPAENGTCGTTVALRFTAYSPEAVEDAI